MFILNYSSNQIRTLDILSGYEVYKLRIFLLELLNGEFVLESSFWCTGEYWISMKCLNFVAIAVS